MYSNGEIVEGHSYGEIMTIANKLSLATPDRIEGFMTSAETFVLPGEAAVIAVKSGQLPSVLGRLTPEMLWEPVEAGY